MRNSNGFSWPETILTLSIIFLIAGTLLPFLSHLTVQLEDKKRDYQASIVLHEAVKKYLDSNVRKGSMQIDQVSFSFVVSGERLCVNYEGVREERNSCVSMAY